MATKSASLPRTGTIRSLGAAWRRFVLSLLILGSLSSVPLLLQASQVTTADYHLRGLQQEREHWQVLNATLKAQIAEMSSLRRVEAVARGELGMVEPAERYFLVLPAAPAVDSPQRPESTNVLETGTSEDPAWKSVLRALAFWRG